MTIEAERSPEPRLSSHKPLYALTQAVAAARDLSDIYEASLDALSGSLGVEKSSVLLFDPDGVMRFKAWRALSDGYRQAVEGHTPWTPDTQDAEPVLVSDVRDEPSLAGLCEVIESEGIVALAFIPLVVSGRLLGKFMLYYPEPHHFGEEEILLAQTIGCQVAFAIDQHNARRVLRDSEAQHRSLVDALAQAVYTTDSEGRILLYNEAAVELWGRRPEVGRDRWCGSWRIYSAAGEPMALENCPLAVALRENRSVRGIELIVERPDGTRANVLPSPTPLRDSQGRVVGAVNVLVDITDLKRSEERLQLYGEIFTNSKDGIAIIDPKGYYVEQNPAHQELTGYSDAEIAGRTPAMHMGDETFGQVAAELVEHGTFRGEVASQSKDGRALTLDLSAFAVKDPTGEPRYYVGIKRDVTERKAAQEAVQRTMEMREQFLSLVSHELRTPISTILGYGLLLLRLDDQIAPDDRRQAYSDIVMESEKLQENIEHLLLLARLDAADLEMEPISLRVVVSRCIEAFRERHPDRQLTLLGADFVPAVMGQETLLSLVLQNLLSNAAKYSPADSPIEVLLQPTEGGAMEVRVRDYGIGLDPQEHSSLFTPFFRSAKARSKANGLGIGLAVCKRVLEAQGSSIAATGRPEGGADFFFSLQPAEDAG